MRWLSISIITCFALTACGGNPLPGEGAQNGKASASSKHDKPDEKGESVKPPFAVKGELDGLLLVWFDDKGMHTATKRSDIPEDHRALVRVDSLNVAPDKRLDADHVYVADLRAPGKDGSYAVRTHTRAWFEAQADSLTPPVQVAKADDGVTIYKASWCGACKAAAAYMRSRGVSFVEKDIEKDATANREMQRKAHAAGMSPTGVPVIDFHGHIILGFDQRALDRLIDESKTKAI